MASSLTEARSCLCSRVQFQKSCSAVARLQSKQRTQAIVEDILENLKFRNGEGPHLYLYETNRVVGIRILVLTHLHSLAFLPQLRYADKLTVKQRANSQRTVTGAPHLPSLVNLKDLQFSVLSKIPVVLDLVVS